LRGGRHFLRRAIQLVEADISVVEKESGMLLASKPMLAGFRTELGCVSLAVAHFAFDRGSDVYRFPGRKVRRGFLEVAAAAH
jgi:hypothetical protein